MDNYNHLKLLDKELILESIWELPVPFEFKTIPWKQQAVCFLSSVLESDGFLSALDLGTGKTKVAIDLCRYKKAESRPNDFKAFVVCLNSAMYNWDNEIKLHSNMTSCILDGTIEERWEKLRTVNANFYIVNFEGLRHLFSSKQETGKFNDKTLKPILKLKPDKKKLSYFWNRKEKTSPFKALIIDESHMIKNFHSLTYKLIRPISRLIGYENTMLLTGTPFGNTPHDIWSQYFIIDDGKTFYKTVGAFRSKYFKDVGFWGSEWKATKAGKKGIEKKLWTKAIRYKEDEVEDLPSKVYRTIDYRLSKEQRDAYIDFHETVKDLKRMDKVVNSHTAFKQICSGFLGTKGETVYKSNSKYKAIEDLLDSMIDSAKIVFFHWFTYEYTLMAKLLKKKKIKFAHLNGATKDKWAMQEKFKNDESCRVMIAQTKVGGASINLISATYCAFISNHGSVIDRKQAEKRIHRGGQTKTCFYYDFIGKGTAEVKVNKDLQKGIDAFSEVIDSEEYKDNLINKEEL